MKATSVVVVLASCLSGSAALSDCDLSGLVKAGAVTGGVVLHLGCGSGPGTASIYTNDNLIVHGLDNDSRCIQQARAYLNERGLYGPISVEYHTDSRLPYADNTVNLVVAEDPGLAALEEIMRVLVPQGVAFYQQGGKWRKQVKARPQDIDEWTHFLHDADNNAVARDEHIGPPRHLQWVAGPLWLRSHETPSGVQAMVTGAGRFFYIFDEGSTKSIMTSVSR